ncbi:MAG: hypothetical protein MK080_08420 [Opitutales bacterium]|nr:hypothetical protein [Opitutales bacterium]
MKDSHSQQANVPEARFLGKASPEIHHYDAGLLVQIPRSSNRDASGIDADALGFVGWDIWTAWEVSFLLESGLPLVGVIQFWVDQNSRCIIESKSVKLYLSSFNETVMGTAVDSARATFLDRVSKDLSAVAEAEVKVRWVDTWGTGSDLYEAPLLEERFGDTGPFPNELSCVSAEDLSWVTTRSALLRSQCRITRQPDWGDVFVAYRGKTVPDGRSLLGYILSMRLEEHFHEEIVEQMYRDLWQACDLKNLLVYAQYTRRGGVDINPMRASSAEAIERWWGSGFSPFQPMFRQ